EVFAQRIRQRRVMVQDREIELVRPPVPVGPRPRTFRPRRGHAGVLALADAPRGILVVRSNRVLLAHGAFSLRPVSHAPTAPLPSRAPTQQYVGSAGSASLAQGGPDGPPRQIRSVNRGRPLHPGRT